MGLPVEQQRRQLDFYIRNRQYARAYTYIAIQIRGDPRWDQRIVRWLNQAANTNFTGVRTNNRLDGSLIKTFIWRMNSLGSFEENGVTLTAQQNQAISNQLAQNVVARYLTAIESGTTIAPDAIRVLDVNAAVQSFGVSPGSWSGGVFGIYFGFDMFGFNGTPGVFQNAQEVRTWLSRAERILQGILQDTGNIDIAVGSVGQGGFDLLNAIAYVANHLEQVPEAVRRDVADFIIRIGNMMRNDSGNLGIDGFIQGQMFDLMTGIGSDTSSDDLLLHRISAVTGFRTYTELPTFAVPGLPKDIRLRADGKFIETRYGRFVDIVYRRNEDGSLVYGEVDGQMVPLIDKMIYDDGDLDVVKTFNSDNEAVATDIRFKDNPLLIEFSDVGGVLGQQLGLLLANGNQLVGIVSSAALQTLGDNLGDILDGLVGGQSVTRASRDAFSTFGTEFLSNLKAAGIGAVSSYLTAELIKSLGLEGFAAELANSAAGHVINTVITNIASGASLFQGISPASIGTAIGSFLGNKLANEVVTFDTIGGQVGAAVGSTLAVAAVTLAVGGPPGLILAAAAAFIGNIIGGTIGSIFGGTPRSGADVVWDDDKDEFVVTNVYSRKGGSKQAAQAMAFAAAEAFNGIVAATGGFLTNPEDVQAGNYGMRKRDYVYRPYSTTDKDAITQRFSGNAGMGKLIGYGIYQGLSDPDFKIAGGNVYVKRALYNTFAIGGLNPLDFDVSVVTGNLAIAERYEIYLANSNVINSLIAAEPNSVFTAEWVITFARIVELGLNRRHESDWYGGYSLLLDQAQTNTARVAFDLEHDFSSGNVKRLITIGDYNVSDLIDVAGQTTIDGTDDADTITLSGSHLLATAGSVNAGLSVDGEAHNGSALEIDVAATINAGDGNDVVHASDRGDNVLGGAGNDTLYGGRLDDWLLGGDGDDSLDAGSATANTPGGDGNYLDGGAGDDQLIGREGSDWLEGGDGVDSLEGGGGDDILSGGAGDGDVLHGNAGNDYYLFRKGDGDDLAEDAAVAGTGGTPTGSVDPLRARLAGFSSGTLARTLADWIGEGDYSPGPPADAPPPPNTPPRLLNGGEDRLTLGEGIGLEDVVLVRGGALAGTTSNDLVIELMTTDANGARIWSGDRLLMKDWYNSYKKIEWLEFADGQALRIADFQTFIAGTPGNDTIIGTNGRDFAVGGDGNDWMSLLSGDDVGVGGSGEDWVSGDGDNDLLVGGNDNDHVLGGDGDDVLSGDAGADEVDGGLGSDVLAGGQGDGDLLSGGAGNDTFRYSRGDGRDTFIDAFAGTWQTIWNEADGFVAGFVRDASNRILNGQDIVFDGTEWLTRVQFDASSVELRRFIAAPNGQFGMDASVAGETGDSIEFGLGINIQDLMLAQSGYDLVLGISSENAEATSFASLADQIWLRDWYVTGDRPIERFIFAATGLLDAQATQLFGGTDAADTLNGSAGADWITGNAGDDTVGGDGGDDILHGNAGSDTLNGGAGNDVIFGGGGNDVIDGGDGSDIMLGGDGTDTASYAAHSQSVAAYLGNPSANYGIARGDQFSSIENLTGSASNDYALAGDEGENLIAGGAGNDNLYGGKGDDTYVWNAWDMGDTIDDRSFVVEEVVGADGQLRDGYTVSWTQTELYREDLGRYYWRLEVTGPGDESVYSHLYTPAGAEPPVPSPGTWIMSGWTGGFSRTLNGANNNSVQVLRQRFTGEAAGEDTIELGEGISLSDLTFERVDADLIVRYQNNAYNFLRIKNQDNADSRVEWLQLNDGLAVTLVNLQVASSDAALLGGAEGDFLVGRDLAGATDTIDGDAGDDVLSGLAGADNLSGSGGDDIIEGGAGADAIDGGANSVIGSSTKAGDTVRYVNSTAVTIDLGNATTGQAGGDAAGDVLTGIENVVGSLAGSDHITGKEDGNRLFGLGGSDTLIGLGGEDVLDGGAGDDTLDGGAGDDNLIGGDGGDVLTGGDGDDFLEAGAGADTLSGNAGVDELLGGADADQLDGGAGADTLDGGDGADTLIGGADADSLSGGAGNDLLQGGDGDDRYVVDGPLGQDRIVDVSGTNRIVFLSPVKPEQLWLSRDGDDLRIGIVGTQERVVVDGYFDSQNPGRLHSIQTPTHVIFLASAGPLITAMTAIQVAAPATLPGAVAGLLSSYWHEGDKAAPTAAPISLTIDEDGSTGLIGLGVVDHDDNVAGYQLGTAATHGAVTVNADTGQFTYTPEADFNGEDSFSIVATDDDRQSVDVAVNVDVNAVNDAPDDIAVVDGPLEVVENMAAGTVIGQLTSSDPEGDTLTYSLEDDADGRFEITGAGLLRVHSADFLDHEADAEPTIRVRVSDGHGGITEREFEIAVRDANDPNSVPAGYDFDVDENAAVGSAVGTIVASDEDAASGAFGQQRYYFWNGTSTSATTADGRYAINANSGAITTASAFDYEEGMPSATYLVAVRDNQGQAGYHQVLSEVVIDIVDRNDPNSVPASYSLNVDENVAIGSAVGTIVASDEDDPSTAFGQQRYYFLNGSATSATTADGRYAINSTTGAITTAAILDHEAETPSVTYTVAVRDNQGLAGFNQALSAVTIGINDLNEANSVTASHVFHVGENVATGSAVGTITASDQDDSSSPFGQQRYYFWNGSATSATTADGRYAINATTGAITTATALDYETGTPSVAYTVAVRDNQGLAGFNQVLSAVTIAIDNRNDPNSVPPTHGFHVAENVAIGSAVGTIVASDEDDPSTPFGQQRYYFWNGSSTSATTADGRYAINANTGAITTTNILDYEAGTPSVTYTVAVRDNLGMTGYNQVLSAVTIGIDNLNEANSVTASHVFHIGENAATGSAVGTITASDEDDSSSPFGQQRYYFWNGGTSTSATTADGRYAINATTGAITTATALDYETGTPSVAYTVAVRDNQGLAGFNQVLSAVTIAIDNRNDPNSVPATHGFHIAENVAMGSAVGTIVATDEDDPSSAFGQQRYYFWNGTTTSATTTDGRYAINATTGAITAAAALDHEAATPSVTYSVAVRDNQGLTGYNQVLSAVTIGIDNLNEANSVPASHGFNINENVAIGSAVGTITATDEDSSSVAFGQQRYYFWNGSAATGTSSDGRYAINATTGAITTAAALNYEAGTPSVAYTIAVRDNQGLTGYNQVLSAVTIGINNLNEANSFPGNYPFSLNENVAEGSFVGQVAAQDPDGAAAFGQQRYYFSSYSNLSSTTADGRYVIDETTGAISTYGVINFEGGPPSTAYTVVAQDNQGSPGYNETSTTVTITVTNVNEANSFVASSYGFSISESNGMGASVGAVLATDLDSVTTNFGKQRYYFLNDGVASTVSADGRYLISQFTGAITANNAPNYEAGSPTTVYTVAARDNQGQAGYNQTTTEVTIAVTDVNEAPTAMPWSPTVSFIAERDRIAIGADRPMVAIGGLSVDDPDTPGTPFNSYDFTVIGDPRFAVVGTTLLLQQNAIIDFEAGATITVTVRATDQSPSGLYIDRNITLTIDNRDDIIEDDDNSHTLVGQQNRDRLYGFGGNDTLDGGTGDDLLEGGTGNDRLIGGAGTDALYGGDGKDVLVGGAGNDDLHSGGNDGVQADQLHGGDGNDILHGQGGKNELIGGLGADQFLGGAGIDLVSYAWLDENVAATSGVAVDLLTPSSNTGAAAGDSYSSIENLLGTSAVDSLGGDNLANRIEGGESGDELWGRDGDDTLVGGDGDDTLHGDGGFDLLEGGDDNDTLHGGDGNDTLDGGEGADELYAEGGDDTLIGGIGIDEMTGGEGDDTYLVNRSSGSDTIFNFDLGGTDTLGLQDPGVAINAEDLWFERDGEDMVVSVLGTTTVIRIADWYGEGLTEAQRAAFKIDFIGAGPQTARPIDAESLVLLMQGRAKPVSGAAHSTVLQNDSAYRIEWEVYWTDNARPVVLAISDQVVNEDGTITLTITATDDTPNAGIQMEATATEGAALLTPMVLGLPNSAGERTLTITPVQHASGTAQITVRAIDPNGASATQSFQLDIVPVANQPTIDLFSGWVGDAGVNIPTNLSVDFPDMDGSEVHEVWIAGLPAALSLNKGTRNATTGTWEIDQADLAGLAITGVTAGWSQDLVLTATARATEAGQTAVSAPVTATFVINAAPTGATLTASVNENAVNPTAVGTVVGSDPDGNALTYQPVDMAGRFNLAANGALTVASGAVLNFEAAASHNIIVRVIDPRGLYKDQTLTVTVVDVNEAPTLGTYSFAINENVATGTAVGTIAASDPDTPGSVFAQQRYYFWTGSATSPTSSDGRYAINATTGAITTNNALNYEAGTPSVAYAVVTRDNQGLAGYNQVQSTVTIGINNLNEANAIPATYGFAINENVAVGTAVGTVAATDQDSASVAFGQQRYYFWNGSAASGTSSDGRYAINATTGAITTAVALSYEAGTPSVAYTVIARDNQALAGYNQVQSTVTIGINDLNEANSIPATYSFGVNENVATGTAVGTVAATDLDGASVAFGQQRYYFWNGSATSGTSSDGRYAINVTTGAITVAGALNFESGTPSAAYTVLARDNQGLAGYNQVQSTVTIGINNLNEANAIPATYSFAVNENVAVGTGVGTVAATDLDSPSVAFGQQRYYFWNGTAATSTSSDGRYTINATSGAITTAAALNFEAGTTSVAYNVVARDNQGLAGYNQVSSTVTIGINNLNEANAIPATYGFAVNENVAVGTAVGTVAATDQDSASVAFGQQRYYFWNGTAAVATTADGRYTINATTGAITTAAALNYESGTPSVAYAVIARDNQGLAGYNEVQSTVTIGINNLNDPNSIPATYGFAVNENVAVGSAVGTVAATDPDGAAIAFGQQRYYFWNGSAATATSSDGRYTINVTTGAITTAAALNYEAGTPSVAYTVIARDNQGLAGYNQAQSTVTIGINDLNEANAIPASYGFAVNENAAAGTAVGTVAATDQDGASVAFGQQRYYFWNGSAASGTSSDGRYAINATTGAITVAGALNYEAGTPSVAYTVIARDNQGLAGYNQVQSTVTIGINDLNEANSIPATYGFAVNENVAAGTGVGTVAASDQDSASVAFGQQRYYFWNGSAASGTSSDGRYAINATSGMITVAAALNYEAGTTSVAYTVIARDNQGLAGYNQVSSTVTIGIADVNEANAIPASYGFAVNENVAVGTAVGTVAASDQDSASVAFGQQRYYFWNGSAASGTSSDGRYAINVTTGAITTAAGLNYEAGSTSVAYTVIARDNQGLAGYNQVQSTVTIGINDLNEANSIPGSYGFGINENVAVGTAVGTVAATDLDSASVAFGQQRYYFWNGSAASGTSSDGRYAINATTGAITTAAALNYEAGTPSVAYTVIARDNQGLAGYNQVSSTVTIGIADLNEANSIPGSYGFGVNENVAVGTAVGTVAASDQDSASVAYGQQRYYFWNGSSATATSSDGRYTINATSGAITTAAALNYEAGTPSVAYTVVARDNQGAAGYNQDSSTVTIGINNLNETPTLANQTFSVPEQPANPLAPLITLAWGDPDGTPANGHIFSIVGGDPGAYWSIDNAGRLYAVKTLNYEDPTYNNFVLRVRVVDQAGSGIAVESDVTVSVYNTNDAPMPTGSGNSFTGAAPANATVGSVTHNDPDPGDVMTYQIISVENLDIGGGNPAAYRVTPNGAWAWVQTNWSVGAGGWKNREMIRIRVTDSAGASADTTITVTYNRNMPFPPIVLDLDDDGLELVSRLASNVHIDMDGDGVLDRTGWVAPDDGFLALDRNGDGIVTDAGEITFAGDLEGAVSDLEGLRAFDTNEDGYLEAGDDAFDSFMVWQDLNQDGLSETAEIRSLTEAGIAFINLMLTATGQSPANAADNVIYATGEYIRANGTSGLLGDVMLSYEPSEPQTAPPVILDLDGDGVTTTDLATDVVRFDMDGDGELDRTGWVGAADGLLALDRNADGIINDITEISFTADLPGAKTDLEGLRAFDSNRDGLLSAADARFGDFRLWIDADHDAQTDAGELKRLPELSVVSISLNGEATGNPSINGKNVVYNLSSFLRGDGTSGLVGDVGLAFISSKTGTNESTGTSELTPQEYRFGRRGKRYTIETKGGQIYVQPRSARGTIDPAAGGIQSSATLMFRGQALGLGSAIVLDLDGDGVELRKRKKSDASFDMNADGTADDTGWVHRNDGILVLDRNGNGLVDGAGEMSFLADLPGAMTGLQGLNAFDSNRDGLIDADDSKFGDFQIWQDVNGDGRTDAGELKSLEEAGIASIDLEGRAKDQQWKRDQNIVLSTATFTRADGSSGTAADVALAYKPSAAAAQTAGDDQRRLALLVQEMASFGARPAAGELRERGGDSPRFDFFAG